MLRFNMLQNKNGNLEFDKSARLDVFIASVVFKFLATAPVPVLQLPCRVFLVILYRKLKYL